MSYLKKIPKITRRILPAIIGIIIYVGYGVSGESGVNAESHIALIPAGDRAEIKNTLDAAGEAAAIDIDNTIDLRINALAGLAVFVYFARTAWKARNRTT